uniref:4-hydroxy-tetrahydrodipicolinate synthase n=1 Tax=Rhizobium rhizogenes TaxID=359 RepID=A0A7S4ZTJ3_RHIRH|nr:4-hydroxy-tetrahydrodipicolinate synthase [Rhizobium rhizogenes]QCL09174.1 dihydrodipicolinate synthase [Rhizobium rhizogenes]QCL09810.1 dihydrodipicolinate synthase [Rhizobium rhizogenes]
MRNPHTFEGAFVALVTPFIQGKIDEEKYSQLIAWHRASGMSGIVVCGTTGETPTLQIEEQERLLQVAVQTAGNGLRVIAGTGSYSTEETIQRTRRAEKLGADAALVVCPYYNRPTQEGLFLHFKTVAASTALPIILYNLPSRTGVNLQPDTLARLVEACSNILAIKEGAGSLDQMSSMIARCGPNFSLLSSDDNLTLPSMAVGAKGVVSTIGNIVPSPIVLMTKLALAGDFEAARAIHFELLALMSAAFLETNPIPIKEAMEMLGIINAEFRLPLCRMGSDNRKELAKVVAGLKCDWPREAATM